MSTAPLVRFEGNWPPGEQDLVEAAAAEAEAAGFDSSDRELIAPWVAVRRVMGNTPLYMAARQKEDAGLVDQSAAGLADRIRRFAEQKTGTNLGSEAPGSEAAGDDSLFQLIYESEATRSMSEADLHTLLQKARSKNERLGITGLLLYAQDRFLQVLEGSEEIVRELYTTIQQDPRHTNVRILFAAAIDRRTFPDWEMGIENLTALAGEEGTSDYLQTGRLHGAAGPMGEVVEALERFRRDTS